MFIGLSHIFSAAPYKFNGIIQTKGLIVLYGRDYILKTVAMQEETIR